MAERVDSPASNDIAQTQSLLASDEGNDTKVNPENASPQSPVFGSPVSDGEVGTLGPYRIVKQLGRGGMGAVYAAIDTRLDRKVAMKVMLPEFAANSVAKERFLREARAAAKIKHDNVVTIYEADERDGVPYIAMEYLEGYPLDEFLKKKGNPGISQVIRIAVEMASGLDAAHKLGLIHRDIKPGNLWLEAPKGRVKVLDFGLAKPVDAEVEMTKSGVVVGTPAYMSPEQAKGERVDARSDLFSVGAVLYRLCAGRLPFQGATTMAVLMALGTEEPPPVRELNSNVPESLASLIHQLLAKRADDRPQHAAEVVNRVRAIAADMATPQARRVERAPSQPEVLYVPMSVSMAAPEANPFADIDAGPTELETPAAVPASATQPIRKKPGRGLWLLLGGMAFALLVIGRVIVVIKNKDGTETKIEVPDGATVTIKDKTGKELAKVGRVNKPPVVVADADRKAAEWALSLGGFVQVDDNGVDIKAVADLPKGRFTLTSVNLNGTPVTDAGLAQLKEIKSLTQLHLQGTQVTDAGLAQLKEIKGLAWLNLGTTQVTDAGLAHLKELKSLIWLHLKDTQVTDAGLAHLKQLKSLTDLSLYGAPVTAAGLAHLKELKNLTYLDLNRVPVTDAGLAHLKQLKSLKKLWLYRTLVTDAGLAHLKELKSLTSLTLDKTNVTDAGLAHLKEIKNLMRLDLVDTKVTDTGMVHLKELKNLTYLKLKGTKVSAKSLADFHTAVPGCMIEHDCGVIEPKK